MQRAIFSITFLLLSAPAYARTVTSDIAAGNAAFIAAYAKGDASAISRMYTPKASVFPPGSPMVTGRDGIQKVWAGAIQSGLKITSLQTLSIEQYGSAAREIGRFTAEPAASQKPVEGKYVVVWKRVNGTWMLDSDIWNMNQ